jgi:hypothetical protein
MKQRPRIAFGSEVCINAARGIYPEAEWRAVWKFVANNYDYAIIPLVLAEILFGIGRGDPAHFDENRKPLAILSPTHEKKFLYLPGVFAVQTVLRRLPAKFFPSPEVFRDQARVVMLASSKADLLAGRVRVPGKRKRSGGMYFDVLNDQMYHGKADHVESLEQLRSGALVVPPHAEEWARLWMLSIGVEASPEECTRVVAALDAAWRYNGFLLNAATDGIYKFENHKSDWIDSQLLFYLSDPNMHLLVDDSQLINRIAGSPQIDRVFSYADFSERVAARISSRALEESAAAGQS